jgi:hypothetical protein
VKTRICFLYVVLGLFVSFQYSFAQSLTFSTNTYSVGQYPYSVVAADVNGDGKLDLISANKYDNTLTVLTNNGSGSFGSNATLNVGHSPQCVVAADVNGDGTLDLISANASSSTLTVLTNNGSGVFGSNATLNAGSWPVFVVAADVNGDSKPDLISANSGLAAPGHTLTVLTNNGSGGFGYNATLNVGVAPICVVAADVNGDGNLDLISAHMYQNFGILTVQTNNGNGGFGSNATLNVGSYSIFVAAADVNGDGKLDLISANLSASTLTVLTNNGRGSFGSNATLNVDGHPECVVAADINGDGKLDLISANDGNTLTVLTNKGGGSFGSIATLYVGSYPDSVVAADVNNDGKLDLISANYTDNTLTVLVNTSIFPPPTFTPTLTIASRGNGMRVAWPSASPGWSLQQNPDLTKPNWLPSGYGGYGIGDDGTNKSLTLSLPMGNTFFRLLHP